MSEATEQVISGLEGVTGLRVEYCLHRRVDPRAFLSRL